MTQTTVLKLALAGMVGLFCLSFAVDMRPTHAKAWGEGNYSGFLVSHEPSGQAIFQMNNETSEFRVCALNIGSSFSVSRCTPWTDGSGENQYFPRVKSQ